MFKISKTAKVMMLIICAVFVVALPIGLVFGIDKPGPYIVGLLLGTLVCIIKVYAMERLVARIFDLDKKEAEIYTRSQFAARYLLTGIVLALAAYQPAFISLLGTIIGLLSLHVAAHTVHFFIKKES